MWLLSPLDRFLPFMQGWVFIHTLLAAVFMGLLARRWYKDDTAAWAAGLLYGFNGFFTSRATVPNYFASAALLPAVLYFLDKESVMGFGVALALQWLAGSPAFSYLTALVVVPAALMNGGRTCLAAGRTRRCLLWGGLLALGLSAVQWIPFLEMLRQSVHQLVLDPSVAVEYSLPPRQFLKEIFLPQWYGWSPAVSGDLGEVCFYAGPFALGLALAGMWKGRSREKKVAWGVGIAMLLSLGAYLPGYRYAFFLHVLRFPGRWLLAATAGLSLLCAAGIARIRDPRWKWAALAAVALDLLIFAQYTRVGWFPSSFLEQKPELSRVLARSPFPTRIYHSPYLENLWIQQRMAAVEDFQLVVDMLMPSYGTAFGVSEARSCQVLRSRRADAFQQRLRQAGPASPLWDEAGVSMIVRLEPEARTVDRGHIQIWGNKHPRPLAYFEGNAPGRLAVRTAVPGTLEADADLKKPARVVFRETAAPGWEASVDGRPAELGLFEDTFMAVAVPGGTHRVAFRYNPLSFRVGLALTLATLLLMGGLLLKKRYR
jgi:hypothetical protein